MRTLAAVGVLLALVATGAAQDPAPAAAAPPTPADLLARYQALDRAQRSEVVRNVERRFQREDYPLLHSIQDRQRGRGAYAAPAAPRWFEPSEFAPVAAPRALVPAGHATHTRATAGMRPFVLLPELAAAVAYDQLQGAAVHRGTELDDDERAANYARGFAPGSDHALAHVLALLDREPAAQRRLGEYFAHLYADREGAVFAGVTLYDAWRSGTKLEMPDTDAIAFARRVLHTEAYVSPIPGDRRRERLYEKMAAAFAAHHEHRTLRQALAATFVAAAPALDPDWQTLVTRCHWLWQTHGRDPSALAAWLRQREDRSAVLTFVDAELAKDTARARQHAAELAELAAYVQESLDRELRAVAR